MKKTKETLNPKIKSMIEEDILLCENGVKQIKGSYDLYLKLTSKYSKIDKCFKDSIESMGKAMTADGWDYRKELGQIKEILNMYLVLDSIPIKYENNVANGVNINIGKLNNKGIIGDNATQSTNKSVTIDTSINTTQKESWFSKLFKKGNK